MLNCMQFGMGYYKMIIRDVDSLFMLFVNQLIILKVYIYVWVLISLVIFVFSKLLWVRGYYWYFRQLEEVRIQIIQVMFIFVVCYVLYIILK